MIAFIPVLSLFLLGLFYLGTFWHIWRNSVHFLKTRADIAARTHNGELDLVSCKGEHDHLEKRHDEFLLVIGQVQRGPCLLLPEISVLSCHLQFPDFCSRIFCMSTSLFYHLISWACNGSVRARGSHHPSEEKGSFLTTLQSPQRSEPRLHRRPHQKRCWMAETWTPREGEDCHTNLQVVSRWQLLSSFPPPALGLSMW